MGGVKTVKTNSQVMKQTSDEGTWSKHWHAVKKDWRLYVLLLPMVLWFALWSYKPMGGLLIAFKNYDAAKGVLGSDFVGFSNFITLMFGTYATQFWTAFRNTFIISLYGIIFGFPIPILLALLMSEVRHKAYSKVMQTFSYLPHFLSEVTITGLVITLVYNGEVSTGVIAEALISLGWISENANIIQEASYFRPIYILTGIWKEAGYSSIVYFAAIMSISPTLYEALKMDGGNKLQEIRYVTFPGMAPTLIIMIILRIGKILSIGYERIILLYNANTYSSADVLSTFVYRIGLERGNQALGASADLFNAIIAFALVIGANYISRQISETSLW
ncbi:putative aldouronate transport system permease protein [Halolactibacillus halophilus]|uniref:Putative aldouronate transport system permease protein n=1 Tax=Halolactibacillus halophilus TaxID=306540 RepID=A0A1I5RH50_9BACI|nr:ABC transporter permease subunit [Halolactibacillus halophilus]GEM02356.1 sugar ABC transporter permease [Halolactibacillus halophilus]SFP57904.1 putative aldouronate transport system permease protein [Halolactibacillus halophilus]